MKSNEVLLTICFPYLYGSYFAPEYFMHGIVDEKTDIFSFGVLLLELVTGRRAVDHLKQSLVVWVCFCLQNLAIPHLVMN